MLTAWTLAASTLLSEDLACVTAGVLVQQGVLSAVVATLSCAVGIFVGDIGLWAVGRVAGVGLLTRPWVARRLRPDLLTALGARLRSHLAVAILASRFTPGARLPLYLASGILGVPIGSFAFWTLVAVLLWTPPVVLGSAALGQAASLTAGFGSGGRLVESAAAIGLVWLVLAAARRAVHAATARGRRDASSH